MQHPSALYLRLDVFCTHMLSICKALATRGGGTGLKRPSPLLPKSILSASFVLKKVLVGQMERQSCGLQSSTELPSPPQCFVKTGEWDVNWGGKKQGKDSTRAHPTHSACHLPRRIIQSRVIFITSHQIKVPFAQKFLSFWGSFVSCTVIVVVGASFIRLSDLASTQNNLRSACGVMKY